MNSKYVYCMAITALLFAGSAAQCLGWTPNFDYNTNTPLGVSETSVQQRSNAAIHNISFVNSTGGRTGAYLVCPSGEGPFPGVLYVHWLDNPGASTRGEFLEEAVALAGQGMVSLLVDTLWSNAAFPWTGTDYSADREVCVRQVRDLRRALDVLSSRSMVDSNRLGYVGHDFGAMLGAGLSGADPRVRCYVLEAGTPRYRYWFFRWSGLSESQKQTYATEMQAVDPVSLVGRAGNSSVLYQFGRYDPWISATEATEFYNGTTGTRSINWYDADHSMQSPTTIQADRINYLKAKLRKPSKLTGAWPRNNTNGWKIGFVGEQGVTYTVLTSTNLTVWKTGSKVIATGVEQFLTNLTEPAARGCYFKLLEPSN